MIASARNPRLVVFVAAVIAAGAVTVALAISLASRVQPLGPRPLLFCILFGLDAIAELRPMSWLSGPEGGQVTASWTFSLALVFLAPYPGLLAVVALTVASDLVVRKPLHRAAFNGAQLAVSLATAIAIARAGGTLHGVWRVSGPTFGWLVTALLGGVAAVVINTVLTCSAIALTQGLPSGRLLRSASTVNVTMDSLMIGLAPVMAGVAVRSWVLLPMLVMVSAGVYQSAKIGISSRHDAMHDLLTGLPNRRYFFDQAAMTLAAAERHGRPLAMLLIDLNGFKSINDRLGHAVGDLALHDAAKRLSMRRRSVDLVARLGGDEFAVLLAGNVDPVDMAGRLLEDLRVPIIVDGVPVAVDASIGIALFPEHGTDVEELLARADAAMYWAKADRVGVQTYDDERDRSRTRRAGLLGELKHALELDELFVEYQPVIDLTTGETRGVEALVRWRHPVRGILPPDSFIPAAEHTDLVDGITERVLRLATAQAAEWSAAGLDLTVAVNASARNIGELSFPAVVAAALRDANLPADRLVLEITENTMIVDPARSEEVLREIRRLGVRIALDDFGTGYSSLARLRTLPIDEVKIDRSFIAGLRTNPGDAIIVRSIVDLASNFGLGIVAEGVEDAETLRLLRSFGCESAQGFLFCHAGSAGDVVDYMALAGGAGENMRLGA